MILTNCVEDILKWRNIVSDYSPKQQQPASYELTLHDTIKVHDASKVIDIVDPTDESTFSEWEEVQTEGLVIHPGEHLLGLTRETVNLPYNNIACHIGILNGKSTLGRWGLSIHTTAGFIDPGFKGRIVLEIENHATHPIVLREGMAIAQLVVHMQLMQGGGVPYGDKSLGSHYSNQQEIVTPKPVKIYPRPN